MKDSWLDTSLEAAATKADFYSGARKILRARKITFPGKNFGDDLEMADCGFTKSKMTMLVRNYLNEESHQAAIKLWEGRLQRDKYGSVGFSTYNHLIKGHGSVEAKKTSTGKVNRASVMGPCIQSVTLTLLNDRSTAIDIFYRTTELFKKFPADLVFIHDVLLKPFPIKKLREVNFHFANITCHPMYFVTVLPHLDNPCAHLEHIRKRDAHFHDWVVKWTARYLCPEYFRGIEKFAQAMRVRKDALERLDNRTLKELQKYLKKHHPGYRNEYVSPEEEEE